MSALAGHWDSIRHALAEEKRRVTSDLRVDETAFLPAAMEIIERPVSPTARWTTRAMLLGLVFTLLWLIFGKVDIVASAPGKLVPADNVKLVQPAVGGTIRAIHVRDGQQVRKGQLLVELDPTLAGADASQAAKALQTAELDAARARAVLSALEGRGLLFTPPLGTTTDIADTQRRLADAQLTQLLAGMARSRSDQTVAAAARDEALIQARKLSETIPLIDEQLSANESLLEKGYVSKLRVIEMRRQRLAALRDRDAALQMARRAGAQMAGAGSDSAQTHAEARARMLTELAAAEADARLRREEFVKAKQQAVFQKLVSPVDGFVTQLAVHTVGGVVEPAKPIMIIVPKHEKLIAEVKLLNKDMGFVRVGQQVAVKIESLPFTRHGTLPGRIANIDSDAMDDENLGLIYPVRIVLDRQSLKSDANELQIKPGMAVIADVKTGQRNLWHYLVSPIGEIGSEAGRER